MLWYEIMEHKMQLHSGCQPKELNKLCRTVPCCTVTWPRPLMVLLTFKYSSCWLQQAKTQGFTYVILDDLSHSCQAGGSPTKEPASKPTCMLCDIPNGAPISLICSDPELFDFLSFLEKKFFMAAILRSHCNERKVTSTRYIKFVVYTIIQRAGSEFAADAVN